MQSDGRIRVSQPGLLLSFLLSFFLSFFLSLSQLSSVKAGERERRVKRTRTNEPQWVGGASKASELEEIGASARGARGRGPTTRVSASKDREDGKEGKGRGESGTLFWL